MYQKLVPLIKDQIQTALILCQPLKNKLYDKYGVGDLSDLGTNKKTPVSRKNITDKVLEALTSPDVLNKIIPILSEKIGETISTLIESEIQACVEAHINPLKEIVHKQEKTIENHEQKICKQFNPNQHIRENR